MDFGDTSITITSNSRWQQTYFTCKQGTCLVCINSMLILLGFQYDGFILPVEWRYFVTYGRLVPGEWSKRYSGVAVPENKYCDDLEHGEQYMFKASRITGIQAIKKR